MENFVTNVFWRSFPNSLAPENFFIKFELWLLSERGLISVGLYFLETQIDRNKKQTNERQKVFDKIYRKGMEYSRNLKAKR